MRSLEATFIDFGIDSRALDPNLIDRWQRTPTEDKPRKKNGAVKFLSDGAVIVKNWATEETAVWQPDKGTNVTCFSERKRLNDEREVRKRQEAKQQADAADLADRVWESAKPASADHPYLKTKNLPPLELRETDCINEWQDRWLLAPLYSERDPTKKVNLECINSEGLKRPIKGALRKGVWGFAGSGYPYETVIICEGWSTAAAISVSLDVCVVFSAGKGNLPEVAKIFRTNQPNAQIIIAADPDPGGEEAARRAGHLVGITMTKPNPPYDWCDIYTKFGADMVRRGWMS